MTPNFEPYLSNRQAAPSGVIALIHANSPAAQAVILSGQFSVGCHSVPEPSTSHAGLHWVRCFFLDAQNIESIIASLELERVRRRVQAELKQNERGIFPKMKNRKTAAWSA